MGTWHQDRANHRLYHDTKWTVVEDPPHRTRTCSLFDSIQAAQTYLDNIRARGVKHAYILKPASAYPTR